MKKYLLLTIMLIAAPLVTSAAENETDKIGICFESYKTCIIDGNGEDFIKFLDKKSIWYYDGIVEDTLYLPYDGFAKLSMIDKFLIMRVRSTVVMGELLKMHGKELISYSVVHGWFDKKFAGSLSIDNVIVKNDTADADVYSNGGRIGARFRFKKENGEWKFALVSFLAMQNNYLKNQQASGGMSEDEYLISILEPLLKIKLDKYVFEPVLKK